VTARLSKWLRFRADAHTMSDVMRAATVVAVAVLLAAVAAGPEGVVRGHRRYLVRAGGVLRTGE
jgi:hypothetical protein